MAARAPAAPVRYLTDPQAGPLSQACSLALAILAATKQATWNELAGAQADQDPDVLKALDGLAFTAEQRDLIERYEPWLTLLRSKTGPGTPGTISIAVCSKCSMFILYSGAAPDKCTITANCAGAMVKASAASKVGAASKTGDVDPEDNAESAEPDGFW